VYCWDLDNGFACVVLIKKTQDHSKRGQPMKGTWDSIHVVEVQEGKKNAHYKLTSTVMLSIATSTDATGSVTLSGNLTRQEEAEVPVTDASPHVCNIGRLVENMEYKLRQILETIYFGKTKDIANELRQQVSAHELKKRMEVQQQINSAMPR